jgi:MoaA/NifB/PqqE/SkfB family radical SAM enzyme
MNKPVLFYHPQSHQNNEIRVDWSMGNEVDFRVPYLHNDFQSGTKPFPDKDTILGFLRNVYKGQRQQNSNRPLDWKLLGGEVTRHPDFLDIVKEIKLEGGGVHIHTTGTRPADFWKEASLYLNNVTFDWHPEWVTEREILTVIENLGDTNYSIQTWINPDNYDECQRAKASIEQKVQGHVGQRLVFQDVNRNVGNYKLEQKEQLKTVDPDAFSCVYEDGSIERISRSALAIDQRREFTGWMCNAGVDQIVINMEGKIFRGWCFVELLGSIYNDQISIPQEPINCNRRACHNGFDQMAIKWDPEIDPEEYLPKSDF